MNKTFSRVLVGAGSLAGTVAANAAAIDVTAVVTDISAQLVPVGLIGLAVLGIVVAIKGYKWVTRAVS